MTLRCPAAGRAGGTGSHLNDDVEREGGVLTVRGGTISGSGAGWRGRKHGTRMWQRGYNLATPGVLTVQMVVNS